MPFSVLITQSVPKCFLRVSKNYSVLNQPPPPSLVCKLTAELIASILFFSAKQYQTLTLTPHVQLQNILFPSIDAAYVFFYDNQLPV